jgi:hypothetical protein
MTTKVAAEAGWAEILLVSDSPIDEGHVEQIRQLFGEGTSDEDISLSPDRRVGRWPLRPTYSAGVVGSLSFHVFLCASFLMQRRAVIGRIRALGCNLELCSHVPSLTETLSITSNTMKQLNELVIQLSFVPPSAAARYGAAGP